MLKLIILITIMMNCNSGIALNELNKNTTHLNNIENLYEEQNYENKISFKKCCPFNKSLNSYDECIDSKINLKTENLTFVALKNETNQVNYEFIDDFSCLFYYEVFNFTVSQTGKLIEYNFTEKKSFFHNTTNEYCIDFMELENRRILTSHVCYTQPKLVILFRIFVCSSCLSFFITFLVYIALPELRSTSHGLCLMCHTSSLLINYFLIAMQPARVVPNETEFYHRMISAKRRMFGYMYFISFYAGILWSNVTCYDIWRTFRSMEPINSLNQNTKIDRKRFFFYSVYAWCFPFTFYLIGSLFPGVLPFDPDVCFIFGNREDNCVIYYYSPLGIILVVNLLFFADTIYVVSRNWTKTDSSLMNQRGCISMDIVNERLFIYVKLFIIMGLPYILFIVSFVFAEDPNGFLPFLTDYVNSLRGIMVMALFILRKRILKALYEKFMSYKFFKRIRNISLITLKTRRNRSKSNDSTSVTVKQSTTNTTE